MPMPGPMAAAPYAIPAPMAWRPGLSSPACVAARSNVCMFCRLLVLGVKGLADVHGGENREDVGLQHDHEDLEEDHCDVERDEERQERRLGDAGGPRRGGEQRDGREEDVAPH